MILTCTLRCVFNQWSNGGGLGTNEDTNSEGTMGFSYTRTQIDSNGNILSGCIEGCTDELACNYNSDANTMMIHVNTQYKCRL